MSREGPELPDGSGLVLDLAGSSSKKKQNNHLTMTQPEGNAHYNTVQREIFAGANFRTGGQKPCYLKFRTLKIRIASQLVLRRAHLKPEASFNSVSICLEQCRTAAGLPWSEAYFPISACCSGVNFAQLPLRLPLLLVTAVTASLASFITTELSDADKGPLGSGRSPRLEVLVKNWQRDISHSCLVHVVSVASRTIPSGNEYTEERARKN